MFLALFMILNEKIRYFSKLASQAILHLEIPLILNTDILDCTLELTDELFRFLTNYMFRKTLFSEFENQS